MFQTKIRHERFLPCLICYFVNLIITSSTASVYLPCAIRALRRSSKHWTTRRRSVSVRERWYFCFLIRTPPLHWPFRLHAHGCYSSAVPTPSDRWLWVARWCPHWRHIRLLTEEWIFRQSWTPWPFWIEQCDRPNWTAKPPELNSATAKIVHWRQ